MRSTPSVTAAFTVSCRGSHPLPGATAHTMSMCPWKRTRGAFSSPGVGGISPRILPHSSRWALAPRAASRCRYHSTRAPSFQEPWG